MEDKIINSKHANATHKKLEDIPEGHVKRKCRKFAVPKDGILYDGEYEIVKKGGGRPEKEIDWKLFENLCSIMCTKSEISSILNIYPETLEERVIKHYNEGYQAVHKRFSEGGKCSLRRNQFKLSQRNATMSIWLGKQYLGQKDNTDIALISPYQDINDVQHENMILRNKLKELEEKLGTLLKDE